jgi:hypothetical protein
MPNFKDNWKRPAFGDKCPSPVDWARLAAFIDGEGCIIMQPRKRKNAAVTFFLKISVTNIDVRLPIWLAETFGGKWYRCNPEGYDESRGRRVGYRWMSGAAHAAWVLHNCHQYFIIKREQADIGLQLQETMRHGITRLGVPVEIDAKRQELKVRLRLLKTQEIKPDKAEVTA